MATKMKLLPSSLIILAIATLPFRYGPVYTWPSIILILAAAVFKCASMVNGGLRSERAAFFYWIKIFSLFFVFLTMGTLNSFFIYETTGTSARSSFIDISILGIYLLGFLLTLSFAEDPKFRKGALVAFLSPLVFAPFVFMPNLAEKLELVSGTNMFEGLMRGDPTLFASMALVSFVTLVVSFINEASRKKRGIYLVGITLNASLILWSGIRSAWFAAGLSAFLVYIFKVVRQRENRTKYAVTTAMIFAISAFISFIVLPQNAQISILNRVFPQVTDYTYSREIIESISLGEAVVKIEENPKPSLPYQHRDKIWPQATRLFIKNPFGLGIQYHVTSQAIIQDNQTTHAHNLFLEAGLQGGIGALIIYLLIIKETLYKLKGAQKSPEWLILGTAFLSLFIIAFVNGGFLSGVGIFVVALILSLPKTSEDTSLSSS